VRPIQGFPLVVILPTPANQKIEYKQMSQLLGLDEFDVEFYQLELNEELPEMIDVIDPSMSEKVGF